jgi:DNA-binding NarL/FixJ family response regulator
MIDGGREAMTEMRRLVDVLSPLDDGDRDDNVSGQGPPPGLDDLYGLCDRLRAGGLPLRLDLDVSAPPPRTAGITAYRIVQEALTNVVKHAGQVPTRVEVRGVLTTFGTDDHVAQALRVGASGFLLKDATPEQLIHAVRVVAGGEALLDPAITRSLIRRVLPVLTTPEAPPRFDALSDRETQVLRLIAQGMTDAEVAALLVVSEATVKTHVSRLLTKLDLRDRVQAVVAAYQHGLV